MVGFLISWLVNSTIVAVVAGFQSGALGPGQWIVALGGGLVLSWLEAKALRHLLGENAPVFDPVTGEPTPSRAVILSNGDGRARRVGANYPLPHFSYDRYGFRFEVTTAAIEMASKVRGSTAIPLEGISEIEPHATGAFTIHWIDPQRGPVSFKANLGQRNGEAFRAIDEARRALNLAPVGPASVSTGRSSANGPGNWSASAARVEPYILIGRDEVSGREDFVRGEDGEPFQGTLSEIRAFFDKYFDDIEREPRTYVVAARRPTSDGYAEIEIGRGSR